jgi:hypothetical protein
MNPRDFQDGLYLNYFRATILNPLRVTEQILKRNSIVHNKS